MKDYQEPTEVKDGDQDHLKKLNKLKTTQGYPWLTGLLSLIVVGYFLILHQPYLVSFYHFPELVQELEFQAAVAGIFFFVVFWDVRRFYRHRQRIEQHVLQLRTEINDIWQSKKSLQARAHIYSGHADKLKLFISDKLLEYIEYDEKFLHFKSIAAEVRHNGVISYDKVKTALYRATEDFKQNAELDQTGTGSNPYREALDAMKYLWDLLDLSTTDNIALHIGNHLIECEEHYYQQILNKESAENNPLKPDFSPRSALIKTIVPLMESNEVEDLYGQVKESLGDQSKESPGDAHPPVEYSGHQFRLQLDASPALLGNENHLILMLENLLKNAQFFANKAAFKQKTDRIVVQLHSNSGYVHFSIYNRGPHIDDADREQIFQLGYSTRRVKEHHGKGLGLFFVNEIVKGYQGRIQIENVQNQENTYSVRVALKNGDVVTKVVKTSLNEGRPFIHESGSEEYPRHQQWEFSSPVESIEVSSTAQSKTQVFSDLDAKQVSNILDPGETRVPQWSIEVKPKRGAHRVQFSALDIAGVKFHIKLPTADSRLSGEDLPLEDNLTDEMARLNEQFQEFDEY
ncbi:hypothetical protein BTA51_13445 [Hahella sp. CCB-MM4]|uniref:sensor histidine kinase n=1 Tax=Hahella sp. (strain CCB-MM4) TaxID=1926491 RepID=UPI000B9C26BF|nr:ATP-binding protein [Hahella sp. CCB-MM4]OZG72958.1 hypothetical protein BTA51_13445 [Hahella sp. CCB-MM4]